jgi:hypothetical protein
LFWQVKYFCAFEKNGSTSKDAQRRKLSLVFALAGGGFWCVVLFIVTFSLPNKTNATKNYEISKQ